MVDERNGSASDRKDITWAAIRHNWPIIVAAILASLAWQDGQSRLEAVERKSAIHDQLLDRDAFKEFAIWQTNVDRDLKDLKVRCGGAGK